MIADTLSRLAKDQRGLVTDRSVVEEHVRYVAENATSKAISVSEIEHESEADLRYAHYVPAFNIEIGTII